MIKELNIGGNFFWEKLTIASNEDTINLTTLSYSPKYPETREHLLGKR